MYKLTVKINGKMVTRKYLSFDAAWVARNESNSVYYRIDKE